MARIIGLTGGIALGKSTGHLLFERKKGYPVIDADRVVHDGKHQEELSMS